MLNGGWELAAAAWQLVNFRWPVQGSPSQPSSIQGRKLHDPGIPALLLESSGSVAMRARISRCGRREVIKVKVADLSLSTWFWTRCNGQSQYPRIVASGPNFSSSAGRVEHKKEEVGVPKASTVTVFVRDGRYQSRVRSVRNQAHPPSLAHLLGSSRS